MEASHEWVEHTGELELALRASAPSGLFAAAARALAELLAEHEPDGAAEDVSERVELELAVSARDQATLLAEWLSELAYHAETDGLIPEAIDRLDLSEQALEATVAARRGEPSHLVKAVTYHRLAIWDEAGSWRARVVFDV